MAARSMPSVDAMRPAWLARMRMTREQIESAEVIGTFVAHVMHDIRAGWSARDPSADADAAAFVRRFEATQRALDALPQAAPPGARLSLELDLLEAARKFVAAYRKTHPEE